MRMIRNSMVLLAAAAFFGITTLGCNTMRGVGEDIESGGEAVQGAAEGAQDS